MFSLSQNCGVGFDFSWGIEPHAAPRKGSSLEIMIRAVIWI